MARLTLIPTTTITAAGTVVGEAFSGIGATEQLEFESIFDYGSGGTTCKVFLQTSLDGGATWFDIASHAYATTDATKISALNDDVAPASQAFAPTDGTLSDNTVINGVIGDLVRAKVISVGTYAGNTTIKVVANT